MANKEDQTVYDDDRDDERPELQQPPSSLQFALGNDLRQDGDKGDHSQFEEDHAGEAPAIEEETGDGVGLDTPESDQNVGHEDVEYVDQDENRGLVLQRQLTKS